MTTLFLHAGLPKCASSSLQTFLHTQQHYNKEFSDLYTYSGDYFSEISQSFHNNNALAVVLGSNTVDGAVSALNTNLILKLNFEKHNRCITSKTVNLIKQEFESRDFSKSMIISSEIIPHFDNSQYDTLMKNLRKKFDQIKIIMSIRHPEEIASSYIQQAIKWGLTIESELECYHVHQELVQDSINRLVSSKMDILPIEVSATNVYAALCNYLGISANDAVSIRNENVSLSNAAARELSKLNSLDDTFVLRDHLWGRTGNKFKLTTHELHTINKQLRQEIDFFNYVFGTNYH